MVIKLTLIIELKLKNDWVGYHDNIDGCCFIRKMGYCKPSITKRSKCYTIRYRMFVTSIGRRLILFTKLTLQTMK
jgi:hypothetical protein